MKPYANKEQSGLLLVGINHLPRKAAQFIQKVQNFLPANIPILNVFRFWRFRAWEKRVGNVAWVAVSYVLLTHPTIGGASPPKIIPPPRSYVLHNSCGVFPKLCNGLLVNGNQINVRRSSEFIHQNRNDVSKFAQSVTAVFSESQKMRQQSEGETNNETHTAGYGVWKPCIHIMISEICGLLGFCVALVFYGRFKKK
jgi:hypothetical protein